jgi:hypothetical protein
MKQSCYIGDRTFFGYITPERLRRFTFSLDELWGDSNRLQSVDKITRILYYMVKAAIPVH